VECPRESHNGAELWIGYVAGTLSPDVELALRAHLDACASCRETVEAQRAVWAALDSWTPVQVSPGFNDAVYQRLAAEEQVRWWSRMFHARWSWRPAMPLAAVGAALIVALLLRSPSAKPPSVAPPVSTPQIEQVERALEDMDMLKQLGVAAPQEQLPSPSDEL
jgi:anti-sigma factor RsiW